MQWKARADAPGGEMPLRDERFRDTRTVPRGGSGATDPVGRGEL
ncbi:hypothetical protein STAFG_4278 [Streptomyces afghaniensis 772]|uniref:Uncharacterized protein n=1 Tax=Streptomyces afghaniensis 772 TaxID=1283301 RepID=S4MPP1_9ACTN|nr:hypothetical protein STAFG_4278 [Streptomyces afghaniensis 772]